MIEKLVKLNSNYLFFSEASTFIQVQEESLVSKIAFL